MPIPLSPPHIYPPAFIAALNGQSGSVALVAGTATVTGVTLTANSVILLQRKTQGGTVSSTVEYEAPGASRGSGLNAQFVINASIAAGTVNAADTSTIDWLILG